MGDTDNPNPRVLLVGMADSIHLARWIMQFRGQDFQFRLVSSSPHRRLHPDIRAMVDGTHFSGVHIEMSKVSRYLSLPLWVADRFLGDALRAYLVRRTIQEFSPQIVHALELQNAGYTSAKALAKITQNKPIFLATNYGSEIIWFQRFPKHRKKLVNLLRTADAFSAECQRDVDLALDLGFTGRVLETIPVSGGIDPESQMRAAKTVPPSLRTSIVLKGYQNVWGQALVAIEAFKASKEVLKNYTIEIFSCNQKTIRAANKLRLDTGLTVITHKKHSLSHKEILEMMKRSRVYIGLSKSDGISTSMLEAMSQGAVPIQSNTSCGSEWIRNQIDGYLVPYDSPQEVAANLKAILDDEPFAQRAQKANFATIAERYDSKKLSKVAASYYSTLLLDPRLKS